MMSRPLENTNARQLARQSQFYLQEAILEVLNATAQQGLLLGQIARILGLPNQGYNAAITGQLRVLCEQGKVEQPRGPKTEWTLTVEENRRRNEGLEP